MLNTHLSDLLSDFKGDETHTMLKATKPMEQMDSGIEFDWLKWDKADKWVKRLN